MVSEARKAANVKWDKANMTNVCARMPIKKAEAFKKVCLKMGKTPNKVLNEFVQETIDQAKEKGDQ